MAISSFDLFKIGIGPSSSHTVGPMRAARLFVGGLQSSGQLDQTARVVCSLYGSLGATGKGHGSDTAVLLGSRGTSPTPWMSTLVPALLARVRETGRMPARRATHDIAFKERDDLLFYRRETLPFHTNGLRLQAFDSAGAELVNRVFYSVGGGFVVSEEVAADGSKMKAIAPDATVLPLPFRSGDDLLVLTRQHACSIADVMRTNERHWRTDEEIDSGLLNIWRVMQACVVRGCNTPGMLPGGFKVKRRAPQLYADLCSQPEKQR